MYFYLHTFVCIYIYLQQFIYTFFFYYSCIFKCVCKKIYLFKFIFIYLHTHIFIYIYISVCVCVFVFVFVFVYKSTRGLLHAAGLVGSCPGAVTGLRPDPGRPVFSAPDSHGECASAAELGGKLYDPCDDVS